MIERINIPFTLSLSAIGKGRVGYCICLQYISCLFVSLFVVKGRGGDNTKAKYRPCLERVVNIVPAGDKPCLQQLKNHCN
jgi:hypothetical protein